MYLLGMVGIEVKVLQTLMHIHTHLSLSRLNTASVSGSSPFLQRPTGFPKESLEVRFGNRLDICFQFVVKCISKAEVAAGHFGTRIQNQGLEQRMTLESRKQYFRFFLRKFAPEFAILAQARAQSQIRNWQSGSAPRNKHQSRDLCCSASSKSDGIPSRFPGRCSGKSGW